MVSVRVSWKVYIVVNHLSPSHLHRDRRKLTFYFKANERIDFRELVRELFKIYKTRIWMCAYASMNH